MIIISLKRDSPSLMTPLSHLPLGDRVISMMRHNYIAELMAMYKLDVRLYPGDDIKSKMYNVDRDARKLPVSPDVKWSDLLILLGEGHHFVKLEFFSKYFICVRMSCIYVSVLDTITTRMSVCKPFSQRQCLYFDIDFMGLLPDM